MTDNHLWAAVIPAPAPRSGVVLAGIQLHIEWYREWLNWIPAKHTPE